MSGELYGPGMGGPGGHHPPMFVPGPGHPGPHPPGFPPGPDHWPYGPAPDFGPIPDYAFNNNNDPIKKRRGRKKRKVDEFDKIELKVGKVQACEKVPKSDKLLHSQVDLGEEKSRSIVSGIAEFGMFVKMDENQCEGLVTMNDIPGDRFYFDQNKFAIIGTRNKKEFNFGDKVKVRIYEIHPQKRQIDLELVED